jgi:pimeloyl-ACP methyl ester carboxylesterase
VIRDWWAAGEHVTVELGDSPRSVFIRRMGSGPTITLLHGFPSCSYDWAKIASALAESHSLLLPDFLGFGASEKPPEHDYSLHEQADLVEAVWRTAGVDTTAIVAHDYAVTVTQELLARREEGRLKVELTQVHLLNGGLYPDLHRPQPAQELLADPEQGRQLAENMNEEVVAASLRPTFAEGFDAAADSRGIWKSLERDDGYRNLHRLIGYMAERREFADRWVGALESTDVPLAFIWGMLDPISGAHIAERIRERLPDSPLLALEDVAHWPQLEAPERVTAAALRSPLP